MQRRTLTWTLARIALAVLFVGLILAFLDLNSLFQEAARLSWGALVWATLFNIVTVVVLTLRWFVAVRRYVPGAFWWHARHYWTSILFNLFTPAALGSDVYRIVLLRGTSERGFSLFGLILQERLVGLSGQAIFFLLCLAWLAAGGPQPLSGVIVGAGWALLAVAAGSLIALWTGRAVTGALIRFLPERWRDRVHQVGTALRPPSWGVLGLLLGLTLVSVLTWTLAALALAEGIGAGVSVSETGLVAVLGEIARWLPLSLQGIGPREAVYAFGFELLGHAPEAGFVTGAVVYLLNTVVLLLFGGVTIGYGWRKDKTT
jgi:uncharacterized membrane protein YbhN (UPF0104 family)